MSVTAHAKHNARPLSNLTHDWFTIAVCKYPERTQVVSGKSLTQPLIRWDMVPGPLLALDPAYPFREEATQEEMGIRAEGHYA
jgi:hypothetical protein